MRSGLQAQPDQRPCPASCTPWSQSSRGMVWPHCSDLQSHRAGGRLGLSPAVPEGHSQSPVGGHPREAQPAGLARASVLQTLWIPPRGQCLYSSTLAILMLPGLLHVKPPTPGLPGEPPPVLTASSSLHLCAIFPWSSRVRLSRTCCPLLTRASYTLGLGHVF